MPYPWETEPNQLDFTAHGFNCYINRVKYFGHLCGYIQIPSNHPWYEKDYNDIPANVHGGLTWGGLIDKKDGWWIGFDCAHAGDLTPFTCSNLAFTHDTYKDIDYVTAECRLLAKQAAEAVTTKSNYVRVNLIEIN